MNLVVDLAFAWVALILSAVLAIVWLLKRFGRADTLAGRAAHAVDRWLRRHHRWLGVALVAAGLVHGLFSSATVLSLNAGTALWVLSMLLGLTWILRRPLRRARGWVTWHRVLTLVFAGTLAWHVADVGGLQAPRLLAAALRRQQATTVAESAAVSEVSYVTSAMVLADGVYTGSATGFGPNLAVKVTVSGGRITAVQVVSHNEVGLRFYGRAIQLVPQEIVASQTTNVDAVSGATFTSTGIINAVNNALAKALVSGTLPADRSLPAGRGGRGA